MRVCCTDPRHVSNRVDVVALDVDASRSLHKEADFALGQLRNLQQRLTLSGIGGRALVPMGPPTCCFSLAARIRTSTRQGCDRTLILFWPLPYPCFDSAPPRSVVFSCVSFDIWVEHTADRSSLVCSIPRYVIFPTLQWLSKGFSSVGRVRRLVRSRLFPPCSSPEVRSGRLLVLSTVGISHLPHTSWRCVVVLGRSLDGYCRRTVSTLPGRHGCVVSSIRGFVGTTAVFDADLVPVRRGRERPPSADTLNSLVLLDLVHHSLWEVPFSPRRTSPAFCLCSPSAPLSQFSSL